MPEIVELKPKRTKKVIQEAAVEKVVKTINIKEFLAMPKADRPSTLMSKSLDLALTDEINLNVVVKQLTATEVGLFNRRILDNMPTAPLIEHVSTQASKDPKTGGIRPAGTYREPNPTDATYVRSLEIWFNNAAITLALFSGAESMGIDILSDSLEERLEGISDEFPPAALMAVALAAAECNPGLNIANEILQQYYQMLAEQRMTEEYKNIAGTDERSEN